ncbi:selenocysteine-specific translation elongation factor [Engelhardtia mirabilis]|uniref:Selenocysteine-specific elongation factor n=1 Tax=Engelhardtia mirabilis TaxID=2528011 RepID=A0A518BJ61_9BACT|nr:Selenocysteine-specific elongation factor [Planctomycetes bacterium Pla133]QDV01348.1 Selenocysteine-specific elongation factor [Planctomycetes bacterium Pla86]
MEIQPVVVGTAGHIDHGKSTLVRALTGIDPDRLKEERERGLTIDLGFANFALADGRRVGIVDVPGHERFVRNMVAGATGVDLVVLVVAADDGVMPQTREHLAIMEMLGLERGLVALTKIDAVDPELAEMAAEEVGEFLAGTFLADAPVMPVSGVTGAGLEEFREALTALCLEAPTRSAGGVFRMPVQRVFSAKGFGTVTTGIPVSGTVEPGDEVEVLPLGRRSKVRGTQAYGQTAARVRAGHSSALNLSDIEHGSVRRGDVVATPGYFRAADMFAVRIRALRDLPRPIKDRTLVRFHTGTADPHGELVLLDASELRPGAEVLAQVRLSEPIVAAAGDRFVLRLLSPERTLGGGVVLESTEHRLKRDRPEVLSQLASAEKSLDSPAARALAVMERRGPKAASLEELAAELQQPRAEVQVLVEELREQGLVLALGRADRFAAVGAVEDALAQLEIHAKGFYADHPLRLDVGAGDLRARTGWAKGELEPLLERAAQVGRAEHRGAGAWRFDAVRPADPAGLGAELEAVHSKLRAGAHRPPAPDELGGDAARTTALLDRLVDEGRAVRVGPEFYFDRGAFDAAVTAVKENCAANGSLDIPKLRERLDTTRKWVIPLLEYLDGIGVTMRQGSHRVLRSR